MRAVGKNPDADVIIASTFAHILKERSIDDDYKDLIGNRNLKDNGTNEGLYYKMLNDHLRANKFESEVVSDYYFCADGKPIKLETSNSPEPTDLSSGHTTLQVISYGPSLRVEYTFPHGVQTPTKIVVVPSPDIKKKN